MITGLFDKIGTALSTLKGELFCLRAELTAHKLWMLNETKMLCK